MMMHLLYGLISFFFNQEPKKCSIKSYFVNNITNYYIPYFYSLETPFQESKLKLIHNCTIFHKVVYINIPLSIWKNTTCNLSIFIIVSSSFIEGGVKYVAFSISLMNILLFIGIFSNWTYIKHISIIILTNFL